MNLYSIIIAVYNVEKYLEECLDSILEQTYTNWEVILVDDGSKDNSGAICDKYVQKDDRFKAYHRENSGSLMARRFGIENAKGDYLLFIDSDDYVHVDLLKTVNDIINNTQSDLVVYRYQCKGDLTENKSPIIFNEGTIIDEKSKELMWKKVISGSTLNNLANKVVKSNLIDREKDYSKYAFLDSGTDLMQSLPIMNNATKIYFTEQVLYYYRYNISGISSSKKKSKTLADIERHLETRRVILAEKEEYIRVNNIDTQENMKLFYRSCFISSIDILVSWLEDIKDKKKRKSIVDIMIKEEIFVKCKEYITEDDLTERYRNIYRRFVNNQEKLEPILSYYAFRRKVGAGVYRSLNSIRRIYK